MDWKYCLVNKTIKDFDGNDANIVALHFMFVYPDEVLISEKSVKVEGVNKEELVKHLFQMIKSLQSEDLEIVDESELELK